MSDSLPFSIPRCCVALVMILACMVPLQSKARDAALDVVLWEVSEQTWQVELETLATDSARLEEQLHKLGDKARTVVTVHMALKPDQKTEWKQAEGFTYASGFEQQDEPTRVKGREKVIRMVGTFIEAGVPELTDEGVTLELNLHHDLRAPTFRRAVYGTAAMGPDRAVQSVPLPDFKGLDWQGKLLVTSNRWLLAASLLQPNDRPSATDPGKRMIVMVRLPGAPEKTKVDAPPLVARQRVIRAPQLALATMLATPTMSDREILGKLQEMVKDGSAHMVSDVQTLGASFPAVQKLKIGSEFTYGSEMEQDFDNLIMLPIAMDSRFAGTTFDFSAPWSADGTPKSLWTAEFAPRGPEIFQWPVVWPDGQQQVPGWWDELDSFRERVQGQFVARGGAPGILAVMPPADSVWPGTKEPWLDLFEARLGTSGSEPAANVSDAPRRVTVLAIEVPAAQALQITEKRVAADDSKLLRGLLKDCNDGRALLRLCTTGVVYGGDRAEVQSARDHCYPTEMQTFPSAWNEQQVGSLLQVATGGPDRYEIELSYDPAPPRIAEWPMCQDRPLLVAWQPAFRRRSLAVEASIEAPGCGLIAVQDVPAIFSGGKSAAAEARSVLYFACVTGWTASSSADDPDRLRPFETEFLAFEVPDVESFKWGPPSEKGEVKRWDDSKGLKKLLDRLPSGKVSLAAHVLTVRASGGNAKGDDVEDVPHVAEYDPSEKAVARSYRPTAFETLPTGTVTGAGRQAVPWRAAAGPMTIEYRLQHDIAMPAEPTLQQILDFARQTGKQDIPDAKRFQMTWQGTVKLMPGGAVCLGAQSLLMPDGTSRCLVAYLRIREVR